MDGAGSASRRRQAFVRKRLRHRKRQGYPKEIFVFAKWILGIAAAIYLVLVLLHVGKWRFVDAAAMNDVWDKMTVFLNSVITLVLGLYFGAKKEDAKKGS